MHLEWFTHSINEDGEQSMHIRPAYGPNCLHHENIVVLDIHASRMMIQELNRAAMDIACDFASEKQHVLARYYESFRAQTVQVA